VTYLLGLYVYNSLFVPPNASFNPLPNLTDQSLIYSIFIFIIVILLLSADFYYLKNIAGRRLVGLRWWNEVLPATSTTGGTSSHWVFESADALTKPNNATDSRFFWLLVYGHPFAWFALAIVSIFRFEFDWLFLVGMFYVGAIRLEVVT
jgi:hypothetical protein